MLAKEQYAAVKATRQESTPDYEIWDQLPDTAMTDGTTVEQVLRVSISTRRRLELSGKLRGHKLGKCKRYCIGDVRALAGGTVRQSACVGDDIASLI